MRRLLGAVFALALLMGMTALPASADGQDFTVTSSCSYRVSGFQDWGKAAASTRDLSSCTYLKTQLSYGGYLYSWTTTSGPYYTNYLKVTAGYYDWQRARGAASANGYVWNQICPGAYWWFC